MIFQLALTVDGDQVTADFAGSSPQVRGGINAPFPFIKASVYAAMRSIMPEEVPNCHGYTRAITARAPAGTVVNPVLPAACGARGITGYRTIDCMFGALAQGPAGPSGGRQFGRLNAAHHQRLAEQPALHLLRDLHGQFGRLGRP